MGIDGSGGESVELNLQNKPAKPRPSENVRIMEAGKNQRIWNAMQLIKLHGDGSLEVSERGQVHIDSKGLNVVEIWGTKPLRIGDDARGHSLKGGWRFPIVFDRYDKMEKLSDGIASPVIGNVLVAEHSASRDICSLYCFAGFSQAPGSAPESDCKNGNSERRAGSDVVMVPVDPVAEKAARAVEDGEAFLITIGVLGGIAFLMRWWV
ncbi:MAG: hypothetical protein ACLQJR_05100 [Stellaceae bacterium]